MTRSMAVLRLALPVLAVAGSASAACSATATATVENSGDVSAIATCTTYSGSIAVATGLSDDISFGTQLKKIDGSLIIKGNQNIKRVDGDALTEVTGDLQIDDDSQLAALSFPKLGKVKNLLLKGLASLRNLNFDGEVKEVETLDVQNTQLQSLKGINLEKAKGIIIAGNPSIANISMKLANMTGAMEISKNNADLVVAFPNLETARNLTFRAVGNLSLPALTSPGFLKIEETKMESFYAPNLTEVKDSLSILNNDNINDISFPLLTDVGTSFVIANNTALTNVTKLPKLKNVGAALDISGNLTRVETPSLDYVKGVFNLQSTTDLGNSCDAYNALNGKSKLGPKNRFKCQGKLDNASTAGGPSGTSSGGSQPSGAASPMNVQSAYLGMAGLVAVLLA